MVDVDSKTVVVFLVVITRTKALKARLNVALRTPATAAAAYYGFTRKERRRGDT